MLATLDERPIPRALPLGPDPDWSGESASKFGGPFPVNDDLEPPLNLNDHLIRNPDSTFLVRVAGEALADAGLHDGDLLVMDRATPPLAGSVALVIVEGVSVLTRLSRDTQGRLRASAAESGFGPLLDGTTRVGVARWVIHRLWPGRPSS